MANTDDMINVAQGELEQLVGQNARSISETKQTVVGENCSQAHCARMQNGFMAKAAKTGVSMDNLDALADDNVAEDGEKGEDGGKGGLAIDDPEGNVVDLKSIGQVSHAFSAGVGVGDDNDFVPTVDEFLGW